METLGISADTITMIEITTLSNEQKTLKHKHEDKGYVDKLMDIPQGGFSKDLKGITGAIAHKSSEPLENVDEDKQ